MCLRLRRILLRCLMLHRSRHLRNFFQRFQQQRLSRPVLNLHQVLLLLLLHHLCK